MKQVISPLTHSSNVELIKEIKTSEIVRDYKKFNIDVSDYFKGLKKISVYKCFDTGYEFYYPLDLSGNGKFYEHFQEFDWYYMPWKWEHEITTAYLKDGIRILEVGCAKGAFLKKVNDLFKIEEAIGLELNESAKAEHEKWKILNQTVQSFAPTHGEKFDIVCSYQVVEHISDVKSFLEANVACLKKGGKLIISVPNNDSYLKHADNCLNMPPHHMGLWNGTSLKALEKLYPLKLIKVHFEELQDYHVEHYVSAMSYSKYKHKNLRKVVRKINKLFNVHQNRIKKIQSERHTLIGQTILAVYEKH